MEDAVRIALVSGSLNPESLSRQMAQHAEKALQALGADVDFIDLQQIPLPMCDGDSAYSDPEVAKTRSRIEAAKGILIAAPVYNFYLNAAVKNLIELTGSAWEDKSPLCLCSRIGLSRRRSFRRQGSPTNRRSG
jgi:NAD(P)H-dependent FMN reductase